MNEIYLQMSDFVCDLFDTSCVLNFADLKEHIYRQLNQHIPCDAGIWFSRSDMQNPIPQFWQEDTYLYNLPQEFMSNYQQLVANNQQSDPFHELMPSFPDHPMRIAQAYGSKTNWQQTPYYQHHCALFDVENVMSVLVLPKEHFSQVTHVISLYRNKSNGEFSQQDIKKFQFIYPLLVEAFRINLFNRINEDFQKDGNHGLLAIMDRFGHVLDADPDFDKLLEFDPCFNWQDLLLLLKQTHNKLHLCSSKLDIQIKFVNGLFFIRIKPINFFYQLDYQQLQVCHYLRQGYSDNEIAAKLQINHRQVRYLLNGIFTTLRIENRNGLFMLLKRFGLSL